MTQFLTSAKKKRHQKDAKHCKILDGRKFQTFFFFSLLSKTNPPVISQCDVGSVRAI